MIIAALIISATLLLIFAPVILAWIVGIAVGLIVLVWIVSGLASDIAGVTALFTRSTAGATKAELARACALVFGPLAIALGLYTALPNSFEAMIALGMLAAYIAIGISWIREFRKG